MTTAGSWRGMPVRLPADYRRIISVPLKILVQSLVFEWNLVPQPHLRRAGKIIQNILSKMPKIQAAYRGIDQKEFMVG